jgi:DNA-directed RNA polymerase subunit RPC12/RpoP
MGIYDCLFCGREVDRTRLEEEPGTIFQIRCECCGTYRVTEGAANKIDDGPTLSKRQIANIGGWIEENKTPTIEASNIDYLLRLQPPSFNERADNLLMAISDRTEYIGGEALVKIPDYFWMRTAWCSDLNELQYFFEFLKERKFIDRSALIPNKNTGVKIVFNGWARLDELRAALPDSAQGFIAMWFHEKVNFIHQDVIAPAIEAAGYKPHRVDQREHADKIDDEIIVQIRRSRFMVADFTGHRGGVYFEAGFAKGLGLPVFWTCQQDQIKKLHFDIRQYNCIPWKKNKLDEFGEALANRIEAVLGRGPFPQKTDDTPEMH